MFDLNVIKEWVLNYLFWLKEEIFDRPSTDETPIYYAFESRHIACRGDPFPSSVESFILY